MDPPPPTTTIDTACHQWDDGTHTLPLPKLRMMCSYGGHIIPRPHDKSLCYMGGETRMVVADRHTSLADLCSRLSTTLLNGRNFTLKYQLPNEDLDSLVSVTTDEDLDNMVDEYDRLNSSRLRLFLFLSKPETTASMGSLLDDAKSETWFVDALNDSGLLPRGFSDPTTVDNLLEHKDHNNLRVMETDSLLVETTSSPRSNVVDDERSDHGGGTRKPPLPLQPLQRRFGHDAYSLPSPDSKHGGAYCLHSPDSVASDNSSIASTNKTTFTQDSNSQSNKDPPTPPPTNHIYIPDVTQQQSLTQDQQHFYQPRPHFIPTNQPSHPMSSYYQIYTPPPQSQPQPHVENHQYPLYFLPVTQNHPYHLQSNVAADNPTITSSSSSAATPPLYPTKPVIPLTKPTNWTTTTTTTTNPIINHSQQQQYINVSQIPHHHPPTPLPTSNGGKYGYDPTTQDPVYYSQYQSINPASAMLLTQVTSNPDSAKQ